MSRPGWNHGGGSDNATAARRPDMPPLLPGGRWPGDVPAPGSRMPLALDQLGFLHIGMHDLDPGPASVFVNGFHSPKAIFLPFGLPLVFLVYHPLRLNDDDALASPERWRLELHWYPRRPQNFLVFLLSHLFHRSAGEVVQ